MGGHFTKRSGLMSAWSSSYDDEAGFGRRSYSRGFRWRPTELVAMILGFIIFWPIGLAILGLKIWQKKSRYEGDLGSFLRERWHSHSYAHADFRSQMKEAVMRNFGCGSGREETRDAWHFGMHAGMRASGNSAFDSWRDGELARLEEERQKLVAAEREFADYLERLRQAKDREEFERFMAERRASNGPATGQPMT